MHPRRSEMAIWIESSDILSLSEDTGGADSHASDSFCCEANR